MNSRLPNSLTYRDSGVDIDKGNDLVKRIAGLAESTRRPGADAKLGGFGGLFDLASLTLEDPVLVSSTDGVGTKLALAHELDLHSSIGIDLVAMCVNDIVAQGAEPLFFLDYFATGKLSLETAEQVVAGIADGCRQAGCALIGGETAEMPGMYADGVYDLAGFAVGVVERKNLLPVRDMSPGDILIGIPSNGIHSNGFSLVRKVIERSQSDLSAECTFHPGLALGEALLTPTRIYADAVQTALSAAPVKAVAHITGGGLTENVPRVIPEGLQIHIDPTTWQWPEVFSWVSTLGAIAPDEMLRTFNCGIGLVLVAAKSDSQQILSALQASGEDATVIGDLGQATADEFERVDYVGSSTQT